MNHDRRHPLQPLNTELIGSFLAGREVVRTELLATGKSNTDYRLLLSDGTDCVLRLSSRGTITRENYVMRLVAEYIATPPILHEDATWSVYAIVPGAHLEQAPEYSGLAAEIIARLWQFQFESPGWIEGDGSVTPFEFAATGFVPAILEHEEVQRWLGPELEAAVARITDEAQQCEEIATSPCLCHGDLNPTNILIHDGKVSGVLDWEFAHAGDRWMDVGNLLRHTQPSYHDDIRAGLESLGARLPDDWQRRAEFIDLSSHLEFLTTTRSDEFKQTCVAKIAGFVQRYSLCS